MNWPIGNGSDFRGVYDRTFHQVHLFDRTEHGQHRVPVEVANPSDPALRQLLGEPLQVRLGSEIELLEGAGAPFDTELVARGEQTPVFFGSALTNFGLQLFLDSFVDLAPSPAPGGPVRGRFCPRTRASPVSSSRFRRT